MVLRTRYVVTIVWCCIGLGMAQFAFPGPSSGDAKDDSKTTSAPEPAQDAPQGNPPQTRFVGELLGSLFGNECDRCSVQDQVTANRCCQQGRRHCCQFLQPVVGFVRPPVGPGFQQGGFQPQPGGFLPQPGGFQPQPGGFQPGPPGFLPPGSGGSAALVGGQKPGLCQDGSTGVQGGFNQFGGSQCVQQCRADTQCAGIQKCCSIGCSTACQNPRGATGAQGFPGSGGFIPGGGFGSQLGGFGGQGGFGGGGFVQPTTKPGFCPRKINPITDPLGAVGSLLGLRSGVSADDPTPVAEKDGETPKRRKRQSASADAPQNDGTPNTRFFGAFCRDKCFNDFDCPGNLKCCAGQLDDCQQCVNPQFF